MICCFVLCVGYLYMKKGSEKVGIESEKNAEDTNYQEVVYEDEDHLLIPVQIAMENLQDHEMIQTLLQQMKQTSSSYPHLHSVFKEGLDVLGVTLQEKVLTFDFNDQLLMLNQEETIRLLEALTWTFCNEDSVDSIRLTCNGQQVSRTNNSMVRLDQNYDRSLGMNNFETTSAYLHKTSPLMVYGSKQIDQTTFYVPVTMRLDEKDLTMQEKVNLILKNNFVSLNLDENKVLSNLQALDGTLLQDGCLTVNLNDKALLDEASIDPQVSDLLILSLKQIEGVETIRFEVEGVAIGEDESVSKTIVYNPIKM